MQVIPRREPDEVRTLRAERPKLRILDVRTRDARELFPRQIAGADWVPLADVVEYASSVPRDADLVAYCT